MEWTNHLSDNYHVTPSATWIILIYSNILNSAPAVSPSTTSKRASQRLRVLDGGFRTDELSLEKCIEHTKYIWIRYDSDSSVGLFIFSINFCGDGNFKDSFIL